MAKILLKSVGGWNELGVQLGVYTPKAVLEEVTKMLRQDFLPMLAGMRANLSGGVLNRVTGETAATLRSRVRARDNRIVGTVGSSFMVARFWEDGFVRRPAKLGRFKVRKREAYSAEARLKAPGSRKEPPRKWAEPVTAGMEAKVEADVMAAIDRAMQRSGF